MPKSNYYSLAHWDYWVTKQ